jgi:hypothetical protein
MNSKRYELVTKTALSVGDNWTNREIAMFHYFNPNGLRARKLELDDEIAKVVDAGLANSGAHISYGTFNDAAIIQLREYAMQNRILGSKLWGTIAMLKKDIRSAEEFFDKIEEVAA